MAIRWFEGKSVYEVPLSDFATTSLLDIDSNKTITEYNFLRTIIPDVRLITTNDFEFAIEIFVTNDLSRDKIKLIKDFNLPTLRVDLSDFYQNNKTECRENIKFVRECLDSLLTDIKRKRWIFPVREKPKEESHNGNAGCLIAFLGVTIFLFIKNWIGGSKK